MRIFFTIILIFSISSTWSIALNISANAIQNATSGLVLTEPSASNFRINPAYQFNGLETSATMLFNSTELPYYNLNISRKIAAFGIGIGAGWLDHELYQEMVAVFACSYDFSGIKVGISLNYISEKAKGFRKLDALSFDAGIIWQLEKLTTGLSLKNFSEAKLEGTKLPSYLLWETSYQLNHKANLVMGLEKEKSYDFSFKFSSGYQLHPLFNLLAGYQFQPDRLGLGALFKVKKYQVTYSLRTHKQLELTHYVSLSYNY